MLYTASIRVRFLVSDAKHTTILDAVVIVTISGRRRGLRLKIAHELQRFAKLSRG